MLDKIQSFMKTYGNLHDSNFENISYNILSSEITLKLDSLKYDNNTPTRIKLIITLHDVKKVIINETFSWDFIYNAQIKTTTYEGENCFIFKNETENPTIEIIFKEFSYHEYK